METPRPEAQVHMILHRSASADDNGSARREPFGWMALSVLKRLKLYW